MGGNRRYTWDDTKRDLNIANHAYDFADLEDVFDGRPIVTREDLRKNYGERRYNALVDVAGRIVNVTFTPRGRKMHLISVRPASRAERKVYHDKTQGR